MRPRVALAVVDPGVRRRHGSWSPWATILLMACSEVLGLGLVYAGAPLVGTVLCIVAAGGVVFIPRRPSPARTAAHYRPAGTLYYRGVAVTRPEPRVAQRATRRGTVPTMLRLCSSVTRNGSRHR